MRLRFKQLAFALIAFNIALVLLSLVLSWQSTRSHPMQGQLITAGNLQLHVIDSSANEASGQSVVVLIHGASTSALDFSTNLHPRLSEHWRVVSIDRPGHGYSERGNTTANADPAKQATLILDALHAIGIDNPVLLGHSWAGAVVMSALLQEHKHVKVRAGVLIAGVTHPWTGNSAWHVELSAKNLIGDIFRWQYIQPLGRLSLAGAIESAFAPETVPEGYIENTGLTLSLRPGTYKNNALDRTRLSNYLQNQAPQYSNIRQPLLSIAASADHVAPPWNHHERLLEQVPHAQSVELDGAGHAPHHTRTDAVVNTIQTFLRSLD